MNKQVEQLISNLTTYYPRAICHYFPDNSRTPNGGRTKQYSVIVEHFRQSSCVAVHPDTIWILSYNNFEFYRNDSDNRENLQHLTYNGYEWLSGYIAGCVRGGDATASILNTETSCDYMYRNDFVDGTAGGGTPSAFSGDLKITEGKYTEDGLKFEYLAGRATCHAGLSVAWANNQAPSASQRYALLDINTYPINADFDKWKYEQYAANLAQPRNIVFGNGFAYYSATNDYHKTYSVSGTLEADMYGSLRIRCVIDKGDTTSEWEGFDSIDIYFEPYLMF